MNRKEIQKISLQYRTLSSQMLKMNSQEEMYCIQQFFDFISETEIIRNYINECKTQEYDFEQIFADKGWRNVLMLPAKQEELQQITRTEFSLILTMMKSVAESYIPNRKLRLLFIAVSFPQILCTIQQVNDSCKHIGVFGM